MRRTEAWSLAATLVCGYVCVGPGSGNTLAASSIDAGRNAVGAGLVRSFGQAGRAEIARGDLAAPGRVVVDRGGGVLVSSSVVVLRLTSSGRHDPRYLGLRDARFSSLGDLHLDPSGRLVVSGSVGSAPALARLLPSGRRDPAFGAAGVVRLALPAGLAGGLSSVGQAAGGGLVAAGLGVRRTDFRPVAVLLARVDGRGAPDASFGPGGVRVLPLGAGPPRALDGDAGAFLATSRLPAGRALLWRRLADGSPDLRFGAGGRLAVPGALAVAAPPRAGARIVVAWVNREAGEVRVAAVTPSGELDRFFGSGGVARVGFGVPPDSPSLTTAPDGGVAVTAGIRGSLAAAVLDGYGRPAKSFGANGASCVPVEGDGSGGLTRVSAARAAGSEVGLTVAWVAGFDDSFDDVATVARMRWRAQRALTCTSAIERGGVIRISGVRSRSGRLEIVLRKPGRRGRPGRRVGTVRFAQRGAGAHADLWNRRLHGRRLGCQALVASPRLVSAGGRVLGVDAPFAVYPNCPGPDV